MAEEPPQAETVRAPSPLPGGDAPSPEPPPGAAAPSPPPLTARLIVSLVLGQLGVHASMAGLRMAAPLQTLGEGASTGAVGLLLALFAVAPVALALKAGRMADRHGLHRPMGIAVGLSMGGALFAVVSTMLPGGWHIAALATAALLSGAGANFGVLAIQRTAGLAARNAKERVRLFSWLGVAPSLANVLGPVSCGFAIDLAGFGVAYTLMLLLPMATVWAIRRVPGGAAPGKGTTAAPSGSVFTLLDAPGMRRLLFVNWLLATCWDVHSFAVPVLGHRMGFSASTIGMVLGTFTLSVSLIRLAIPMLAHRLAETTVVAGCMAGTAVIYAAYPFASSPWVMGALAALLGVTLGSAQPMIMSTLHHVTPAGRHGESLALRSMAINFSSAVMPLAFGMLGVVVGTGALFWIVGAAVGSGAWLARGLRSA